MTFFNSLVNEKLQLGKYTYLDGEVQVTGW